MGLLGTNSRSTWFYGVEKNAPLALALGSLRQVGMPERKFGACKREREIGKSRTGLEKVLRRMKLGAGGGGDLFDWRGARHIRWFMKEGDKNEKLMSVRIREEKKLFFGDVPLHEDKFYEQRCRLKFGGGGGRVVSA